MKIQANGKVNQGSHRFNVIHMHKNVLTLEVFDDTKYQYEKGYCTIKKAKMRNFKIKFQNVHWDCSNILGVKG